MIVPEFRNAFFPDVITGIQNILIPKGYQVLIMQSNENAETELSNVKTLYNNMVDGLIISFSAETQKVTYYKKLLEEKFPIIQFNRIIDKLQSAKVVLDDHAWAFMPTEHLILQGYKNIVHFMGPKFLSFSLARAKGFKDAMIKHNLFVSDEQIIETEGVDMEHGKATMRKLIENKQVPEAIFAVYDPIALGAMLVMKANNIKIPDDVGIVGFSDSHLSEVIKPS